MFVLRELQAVVGSDGLHKVILLEAFKYADDLVGSFSSSWILELPEPDFPGLPVVQREDMLGMRSPNNRINLVIWKALSCQNLSKTPRTFASTNRDMEYWEFYNGGDTDNDE